MSRRTQTADWNQLFTDGLTNGQLEQEMLSGHLEGQFLQFLVRASGAEHALEIGLFTGYSALAIAEALPPSGKLVACEIDPHVAKFAADCFTASPHGEKIRVEVGPAGETMAELIRANETFDFVFIDANKDGYLAYLDTLVTGDLLSPNALICVDNTLMQGQPYLKSATTPNGEAIARFNRAVAEDSRFRQVLLPIRDGITLIQAV